MIAGAVILGEAEVSLFLIFPVVSGSGWMFLAGVLLIAVSFVLWFVAVSTGWRDDQLPLQSPEGSQTTTRIDRRSDYGGIVLIGPIPIAFGSNRRIALIMLMVGVILALAVLALVIGLAN